MNIDMKENREQRNQYHSAAQTGKRAKETCNQRTGPDQKREFENVQSISVPYRVTRSLNSQIPGDGTVVGQAAAGTPPKRRSLRLNSAMAASRSEASKSGHIRSVNKSSA